MYHAAQTLTPEDASTAGQSLTQLFRAGLGRFATGVEVVTFAVEDGQDEGLDSPHLTTAAAEVDDGRRGITVNSFTSVSVDPPLVSISLQRTVRAHDHLKGRPFTVNILGAEQQSLAQQFAGKPQIEPKWEAECDIPRLANVLSWFECTPWAEYHGGDHTIFVGEVQSFDYRHGDSLGFVNGKFVPITI